MGEVFRARDTRLDRTVAVKTLPAELARNAQLRLRFQREAKAISALSHPNICALYDVGEHEGVDYLVMEFLEGESLAERLTRGPVPLKEALRIGVEIAGALERAHREGVIHRDLKPGNVMLTRNGAKLLDFGLAKTAAAAPAISAEAPTVQHDHHPLTSEGTIVGTFQYMAPEQIEGAAVDARTDIFAFGALLYEMITGARAFSGRTRTSLIASIVASEPRPMSEVVPVTPPQLEHVVQRCLEKEPDARWQSAHDLRLELEWIAKNADVVAAVRRSRVSVWPWIAVAAIAIAAGLAAFVLRRPAPATAVLQTHILPPKGQSFTVVMDSLSISPDGRYVTLAVQGDDRLWLRALDSLEARPIAGTEQGRFPFWSPDSRWIAFFDNSNLKKVNLSGAPPVTLCAAPRGRTGTWSEDGVIFFSPAATVGIHRVPAAGGVAQPVTQLDVSLKETTHRWPVLLPGGKLLYLAGTHDDAVGSESNALYLTSIDNPKQRTLVSRIRSNVAFARGHLLFVKDQVLVAQPFDVKRGTLTGEPFKIAENVEYDAEYFRGAFATTDEGLLIYRTIASPPEARLAWFDGKVVSAPFGPTLTFRHFALSPDGKRLAASLTDPATEIDDIWVLDLERDTQTRITSTPGFGESRPIWSPDGTQLLFRRHVAFQVGGDLVMAPSDGSGGERVIHKAGKGIENQPTDWARDGRILFTETQDKGADRRDDVMLLQIGSDAAPRRILGGPANERSATFSPDERFIAYVSDEAGAPHAYVAPLADLTRRVQISPRPAFTSLWVAEGICYVGPEGLFLTPARTGPLRAEPGSETLITKIPGNVSTGDVLDPKRILFALVTLDRYDESIVLTTDWQKR
jgi:hypothetical protein